MECDKRQKGRQFGGAHLFGRLQGLHEGLHLGGLDLVVEVEQHAQCVPVDVLLTGGQDGGLLSFSFSQTTKNSLGQGFSNESMCTPSGTLKDSRGYSEHEQICLLC